MVALKLTSVGSSTGLIINKEVQAKLRVKKGDTVYLTEAPGGMRLTPYNPTFERQMSLAEAIMRKDKDILRELAK